MNFIIKGLLAALKSILLATASEAIIKWALLEIAQAAVDHTKNKLDDKFLVKIKEAMSDE